MNFAFYRDDIADTLGTNPTEKVGFEFLPTTFYRGDITDKLGTFYQGDIADMLGTNPTKKVRFGFLPTTRVILQTS